MTETAPEVKKSLTLSDRCDRCGAQAFVMATGVTGSLFFCAHHFVKHEEGVKNFAFEIVDEREKINAKNESST
jgi:hypothetical protein